MKTLSLLLIVVLLISTTNTTSFAQKVLNFLTKSKAVYNMDIDAQYQAANIRKDNQAYKTIVGANTSCTTSCCGTLSPTRGQMTYRYYQNTGRLIGGSGQFAINTHGYSGQGAGYNNPSYQCVSNTGPLPATTYKIGYCVNVMHETVQRPCAFYLDPQKPSEMCGRSAFFIHGCNCCTPGDDTQPPSAGCSAGCVVINYANRRKMRVGDIIIVEHTEPKNVESLINLE